MAGPSPKRQAKRARAAATSEGVRFQSLDFGRKNWILVGAGLGCIVAGFLLLAGGEITLAPILLVAGYLGLIPWALIAKSSDAKRVEHAEEEAEVSSREER